MGSSVYVYVCVSVYVGERGRSFMGEQNAGGGLFSEACLGLGDVNLNAV